MSKLGAPEMGGFRPLASSYESISEARDLVRSLLDAHTDQERLSDVLLVTSELVTNAIEHGGGTVAIKVDVSPESAAVTVRSDGDIVPAVPAGPVSPESLTGRGLLIADQLSDDFTAARTSDRHIHVTSHFRLP